LVPQAVNRRRQDAQRANLVTRQRHTEVVPPGVDRRELVLGHFADRRSFGAAAVARHRAVAEEEMVDAALGTDAPERDPLGYGVEPIVVLAVPPGVERRRGKDLSARAYQRVAADR